MRLRSGTHLPGIIAPAAVLCVACTAPATRPDARSPEPSARLKAIAIDEQVSDRDLVEALDSADVAVRLMAIATLQRRTGETYDYDPIALRQEREAAVQAWVDAVTLAEERP